MSLNSLSRNDIAVTLLDFFNQCIAPIDLLFMKKNHDTPCQPLFIIGAPRSGTTLTYQLITQYFNIAYFNNAYNYFYGIPNLVGYLIHPFINNPVSNYESNYGHIKGIFSPGEPANFWFRWFPRDGENGHYLSPENVNITKYEKMSEIIFSLMQLHKKPMVFKNVYHTMTAGLIAKIFPQARFIHVKRDIILNIQSMLKGRQSRSPDNWWSVKPPSYKLLLGKPLWEQITTQIYLADSYTKKGLEKYAQGRFFSIDYETICESPLSFMQTLESQLFDYGYRKRQNVDLPTSFNANNEVTLPSGLIDMIENKLDELDADNRTE